MNQVTRAPSLLSDVLRNPTCVSKLDTRTWEQLIWQARSAELLGQLRHALIHAELYDQVPVAAERHLKVAWKIAELHRQAVRHELLHLGDALSCLGTPVVLLKGAAYCAQDNHAATGRVFNDIDILVPKPALAQTEERLLGAGWIPSHLNAYDQHYYREWMHEIPPMEHKNRSTVLDVHHTIVPPTSGIRPNPANLIASTKPVADPALTSFRVLCPEDMVIHSACHLFFGEFHKGLRDLYDLHSLYSEFSTIAGYWKRLTIRSSELGLAQPVLDSLRECKRLFGTLIPDEVIRELSGNQNEGISRHFRAWLYTQVLRSNHPSTHGSLTHLAQWMAFARSHWLRMPVHLLIYHLGHKAFARDDRRK